MQDDRGFGLIGVVAAVMIIIVMVAAGYLFDQEMKSQNKDSTQTTSAEQTEHIDAESEGAQEEATWITYHYDLYGISFKYPADWQVEIDVSEGFESQPDILIKNNRGQLVTGLYGHREDEDCEVPAHDVDPQPGITIGGNPATVLETCEDSGTWIGARTLNDQPIAITTEFIGQPSEEDARKVVDSITGLTLPIIN